MPPIEHWDSESDDDAGVQSSVESDDDGGAAAAPVMKRGPSKKGPSKKRGASTQNNPSDVPRRSKIDARGMAACAEVAPHQSEADAGTKTVDAGTKAPRPSEKDTGTKTVDAGTKAPRPSEKDAGTKTGDAGTKAPRPSEKDAGTKTSRRSEKVAGTTAVRAEVAPYQSEADAGIKTVDAGTKAPRRSEKDAETTAVRAEVDAPWRSEADAGTTAVDAGTKAPRRWSKNDAGTAVCAEVDAPRQSEGDEGGNEGGSEDETGAPKAPAGSSEDHDEGVISPKAPTSLEPSAAKKRLAGGGRGRGRGRAGPPVAVGAPPEMLLEVRCDKCLCWRVIPTKADLPAEDEAWECSDGSAWGAPVCGVDEDTPAPAVAGTRIPAPKKAGDAPPKYSREKLKMKLLREGWRPVTMGFETRWFDPRGTKYTSMAHIIFNFPEYAAVCPK